MDRQVKISVIMLTYNREKYVSRAIDSILCQTFTDFEFIIVDNGSSDLSGSIADDYEQKDSRIKVIHIEKSSIGNGRNVGIDYAVGDYITFIDDDDTAEADMLDFLYSNAIKEDADISLCGSLKEIDGEYLPNCVFDEYLVMNPDEAVVTLLKRKKYNAAMPSKLIKRRLFEQIRFKKEGKYDDISVVYKYFANANKVVAYGKPKYCFYRHSGNNSAFTTNDLLLTPEQLDEYLEAFRERTEYLSDKLPPISTYALYSEWSYMVSMLNKIITNDLVSCSKQKDFIYSVLYENYNTFFEMPYTETFEKKYLLKYVYDCNSPNHNNYCEVAVYSKVFRYDEYVDKAVESVIEQTYPCFEYYILVNETTIQQIEKYAEKDNRIKIIVAKNKKENLESHYKEFICNHKYLMTVDADDWLEAECLDKAYYYAEQYNLDILAFGNYFYLGNNTEMKKRGFSENVLFDKTGVLHNIGITYQFFRTVWGKLWNTELWKQKQSFRDELIGSYGADTVTDFLLLENANRIGIISDVLYWYRVNPNSSSYKMSEGRLNSDRFLFELVERILRKSGVYDADTRMIILKIYANATLDSLRLVVNLKLAEEIKCKYITDILCDKLTLEAISVKGRAYENDIISIIFGRKIEITNNTILKFYHSFICLLRSEYTNMPYSVFERVVGDKRGLQIMLFGNTSQLCYYLLESSGRFCDVKDDYMGFWSYLTDNALVKKYFFDYDFLNRNKKLALELLSEKNITEFLNQTDIMPYDKEVLFRLLNDYAALKNDEEMFLDTYLKLYNYYVESDKSEEAEEIRKTIEEMGFEIVY